MDEILIDNTKKNILAALVAFQADLKPVEKNAVNPFFKNEYMTLSNIMTSIQPLLTRHKLAVMQFVTNIDGTSALRTVLVHESGESVDSEPMPLLLPKQDPQGQGSAITYARRYALCAILGIVADEDDDASKASTPKTQYATKTTTPVSDKQRALIVSLLEKKGVEKDDMVGYVKEQYEYDLKTLTVDTASELIEILQK